MKKYIAFLIIIGIVIGYFLSKNKFNSQSITTITPTIEKQLNLPDSWTKIDDTVTDLKLEKKVDAGLKPQITLTTSTSKDTSNPSKYVNNLIAGARSAIPSYKVLNDKRNTDDTGYTARISGYYYNKNQKISLLQRVIIKGEKVFVLTSSFAGDQTQEIDQIFDSIVKEKI